MPNDPAARTAAPVSFERLGAQATDSIRRDARRVHEIAERFREQYRRRLEEWMQLRARLDRRGPSLRPVGTDALRAEVELLGRELAALQAQLKRIDVAARQLDLLEGYLGESDAYGDEPTLGETAGSAADVTLRIIQAQEAERQRLAEEIHDGPAQVLTNVIFQVEYLDRVLGSGNSEARAELAFLRDSLREGLDEVRSFIADLRPPVVDVGLANVIGEHAAQLERHGISVRVAVGGIDERLSPAARASVLRIVQEALQNVRKHAVASEVAIEMEDDTLVIADNGRGFDLMRLASGVSRNFGLQFMRERAELMGGELGIESRRGEGTRILVRLPERGR